MILGASFKQKTKKNLFILSFFILSYFTLSYFTLLYFILRGVLTSMIKIIFLLKIFSLSQLGQQKCNCSLLPRELKKSLYVYDRGEKQQQTQPSVNFLNVQTIYS